MKELNLKEELHAQENNIYFMPNLWKVLILS